VVDIYAFEASGAASPLRPGYGSFLHAVPDEAKLQRVLAQESDAQADEPEQVMA
jgi:hypothetical protein